MTLLLVVIAALVPSLLASGVSIQEMESCPVEVNGCSVPGGLPFIYKKLFTPACVIHDVCYRCNRMYEWKKHDCDSVFKENMYRLCEKRYERRLIGFAKKAVCRATAVFYYTAVNKLGNIPWKRYDNTNFEWCKKDCAKTIGDPTNHLEP